MSRITPDVTILICESHIGVISELTLNKLLANKPEMPHITQANPAKNAQRRRCFCVTILLKSPSFKLATYIITKTD